ncbi:hypothetical protein CFC21_111771 [Triticum aestivum]|uniref:Protein kinase domain-containing protein n=4 Tax=Triticinae TaxID=1648030 RepID=A0A453T9T8_AEGTS|nr:cysteine-rich receptor-like protein kinase 6 [Aegilops tauschii subsp. strangulata]XP_044442422.1 cysteine-rich receptor-like protein kinase 6 [Triticum aestivum]KAF7111807.1 hypothetical protein CFC21_111771 [Triticum aestivum]
MASGSTQESKQPSPELPSELPYDFLKNITDDFSDKHILGVSPFGTLYKGTVPEGGKVIAVKKLQENAPILAGKTFNTVVQNVMALKHINIVELIGFCSEAQKKLVQFNGRYIQADITESLLCYEYLPNGSLNQNLFGTKEGDSVSSPGPCIDWGTRFKIINGICQGLCFLHNLDIPLIHMNLKPENILLDENMIPKIADFAMSRVFGEQQTRLCTQKVVGSYGYMAPEYLYRGEISAQSDIYSLGLLIIEITTREQNCPADNQPSARKFIEKVRKDWTMQHIASMYGSLDAECLRQIKACIDIGLTCVEIDRRRRPSILEIVEKLSLGSSRTSDEVSRVSSSSSKPRSTSGHMKK